jgi:stress response protein YsnF
MAGMATLALVGGCCATRSSEHASYYSRTPAYAGGTVQEEQTQTSTVQGGNENMVVPLYAESVNVGKREVDSGAVTLKKIVKTETVNVPVELRREEVTINRENGATGPGPNQVLAQPFQGGETTIQLKREEPVIEKQQMPAGQIVVQKRFATEQKNVQAEVRKEDIDIAKHGNTGNVIIGENVHASVGASGGAGSPGGEVSATASSSGPITDITVVTSPSAEVSTFANRPVEFSSLKVHRVIGDRVIVLSGDNGQDVYVVAKEGQPNFTPGQTVTITGTVKAASEANTDLTGDAAQALRSQRCYIEATKIEPVK